MKLSSALQTVGILLLGGCALTHYTDLDEQKQTDISVSSNVPAELWIDGERVRERDKEHILTKTGLGEIVLKAPGYHDARILVYRNEAQVKNVTSHQSSTIWTSEESSDVTSNLSNLGKDSASTNPTSTVMLPVNLVKFVADMVALPFSFTTEFNPFGYYLAYDKNQFYVEMMPANASKTEVFNAFKMQVKTFVLKNYTGLAEGDPEYIAALKNFSGLSENDIADVLKTAYTPAEAADGLAARMKEPR